MEENPEKPTAVRLAAWVPTGAPRRFSKDCRQHVQDCTSCQCGLPNLPVEPDSFEPRRPGFRLKSPGFRWKGRHQTLVASVLLNFRGMDRQGF
jgi:hypothetical protein